MTYYGIKIPVINTYSEYIWYLSDSPHNSWMRLLRLMRQLVTNVLN